MNTTKQELVALLQSELDSISRRVGIESLDITPIVDDVLSKRFEPLELGFYRDTKRFERPNWNNITICVSQGCALLNDMSAFYEVRFQLIATAKEQAVRIFDVEVPRN